MIKCRPHFPKQQTMAPKRTKFLDIRQRIAPRWSRQIPYLVLVKAPTIWHPHCHCDCVAVCDKKHNKKVVTPFVKAATNTPPSVAYCACPWNMLKSNFCCPITVQQDEKCIPPRAVRGAHGGIHLRVGMMFLSNSNGMLTGIGIQQRHCCCCWWWRTLYAAEWCRSLNSNYVVICSHHCGLMLPAKEIWLSLLTSLVTFGRKRRLKDLVKEDFFLFFLLLWCSSDELIVFPIVVEFCGRLIIYHW